MGNMHVNVMRKCCIAKVKVEVLVCLCRHQAKRNSITCEDIIENKNRIEGENGPRKNCVFFSEHELSKHEDNEPNIDESS
jgi:hypothetical protein